MAPSSSLPPSTNPTPNISTFLASLAGPLTSSSSTLPYEAQTSLISTQLSHIEDQAASLVLRKKEDLLRSIDRSQGTQWQLNQLLGRIAQAESSTQSEAGIELLIPALAPALQDYSDCLRNLRQQEHLLVALQDVHTALSAIEKLEDQVAQGRLEAGAYATTLAATEEAYASLLGGSSSPDNRPPYGWLTTYSTPRAVADLLERKSIAKRTAERSIQDGWQRAVSLTQCRGDEGDWQMTILEGLSLSTHGDHVLSLSTLAESLEEHGKLDGKLSNLADGLDKMFSSTCLSTSFSQAWVANMDPASHQPTLFITRASGKGDLKCVLDILAYLGNHLLTALSEDAAQRFSRMFVPSFTTQLLAKFQTLVPSHAPMQDVSETRQALSELRASAVSIYTSLQQNGIIPSSLAEMSEEEELFGNPHAILRFAASIHAQYSNKVAAYSRQRARQLCVAEDEIAWDAEQIEVEETLPLDEEEWRQSEPLDNEQQSQDKPGQGSNEEDWDWGETDQDRNVPPSFAPTEENLARPESLSSSFGSTVGSKSNPRSISPANSQRRGAGAAALKRGKGALGGVRVIKPSDQMGSGPLSPELESDDAWGLDDDLEQPPESDLRKGEDAASAWGLYDDAEIDMDAGTSKDKANIAESTAAILSAQTRTQDSIASPSANPGACSAETLAGRNLTSMSKSEISPPSASDFIRSASMISVHDLDEDAWGLSDEEKAERFVARSSVMAIPEGSTSIAGEGQGSAKERNKTVEVLRTQARESKGSLEDQMSFTPVLEDLKGVTDAHTAIHAQSSISGDSSLNYSFDGEYELDEDAWGLSAEEQKERADKRASRRFGPTEPGALVSLPPMTSNVTEGIEPAAQSEMAPVTAFDSTFNGGDALTSTNLRWSNDQHTSGPRKNIDESVLTAESTMADSLYVAASGSASREAASQPEDLSKSAVIDAESIDETLDRFSLVSHRSSDRAFPLESALPEDNECRISDVGSVGALPATPLSGRSDPTQLEDSNLGSDVMSLNEESSDEGQNGERIPFFESALPASSASSVATGSAGPASLASLPPTPRAEAAPALSDADFIVSTSYASSQADELMTSAEPHNSSGSEQPSKEPPFPVHSASPYPGTLRSNVLSTGPSSVASGFEGRSDVALPPSPPSLMDEKESELQQQAAATDVISSERRKTHIATTGAVEGEHRFPSGSNVIEEMEDDDDPWADVDAQWETEQKSRQMVRETSKEGSGPVSETPNTVMGPQIGSASNDANTNEISRNGDEEQNSSSAVKQSATDLDASPVAGATTSVASRSMQPQKGRSSSTFGTSPQLRKTALRNAEAEAARSSQSGARQNVRLTADALARNSNNYDGTTVPQPTSRTSMSRRRTEKCKISMRARKLLDLAHQILVQAKSLAEVGADSDKQEFPPSLPLLRSLADAFEIYRALMPNLHRQTLANIPSLAMQFANDGRFLAQEILVLRDELAQSPVLVELLKTSPVLDLVQESSLMTILGKQTFEAQMATQASTLDNLLSQTDSFLRVYQDDRFAICTKVLAQVSHHLNSLHRGWSEVLTRSSCAAALGTLVEAVLLRVGGNILELDDIGEREGERLAELIRLLIPLEKLFPPSSPSSVNEQQEAGKADTSPSGMASVASFVPSWIKITGYLPEILLGSLADVEFLLFEAGGLVAASTETGSAATLMSFTQEEAKRLIKSTFAETPRRAALLSRVEKGR